MVSGLWFGRVGGEWATGHSAALTVPPFCVILASYFYRRSFLPGQYKSRLLLPSTNGAVPLPTDFYCLVRMGQ